MNPLTKEENLISTCCFHGLLESDIDDTDLAGMGTVIIQNVCKALKDREIGFQAEDRQLKLLLHLENGGDAIELPWPGMPDDRPVPLDVEKLPFDASPFYEKEDGKFKKLIDRQEMMFRIRKVWVPHLKSFLKRVER